MSDDLLDQVRTRARANLFWRHLGVDVEDAREGWVRLRVAIRDESEMRRERRCTGACTARWWTWQWEAP